MNGPSLNCDNLLDDCVSAAVLFVISGAKQGIVTLCANVAYLIREKQRLQKRLNDLENASLSSSNALSSNSCTCILTKCSCIIAKNENNGGQPTAMKMSNIVNSCRQGNDSVFEENNFNSFNRKFTRLSTNSFNVNCLPRSSFIRRKYRSLNLQSNKFHTNTKNGKYLSRVSRNNNIDTSGMNSKISAVDDNTAECDNEYSAIDLLASTLTCFVCKSDLNIGQTEELENNNINETSKNSTVERFFYINSKGEVWASFPLNGCECQACSELSTNPSYEVYEVTSQQNSILLPSGTPVLLKDKKVGIVLYLGHKDGTYCITDNGGPLFVFVLLLLPDSGTDFFPLQDVVCPLTLKDEVNSIHDGSECSIYDTSISLPGLLSSSSSTALSLSSSEGSYSISSLLSDLGDNFSGVVEFKEEFDFTKKQESCGASFSATHDSGICVNFQKSLTSVNLDTHVCPPPVQFSDTDAQLNFGLYNEDMFKLDIPEVLLRYTGDNQLPLYQQDNLNEIVTLNQSQQSYISSVGKGPLASFNNNSGIHKENSNKLHSEIYKVSEV